MGGRAADAVAEFMGSWTFIIWQSVVVALWIGANVIGWSLKWDVYPFILLNLVFSTQAAYAAPIIMQAQNRQAERDRHHAEADYQVNIASETRIEALQVQIARLEIEKMDRIIALLEKVA